MGRHRHKKVSDKDAEENITKQLIESGKREELKNMVNTLGLKLYKITLNKHIIQVWFALNRKWEFQNEFFINFCIFTACS